ncbi:uncharacterized protein PFL1_06894 [Pseudozyma flocculosa PF-1]|uniref:Uncharacterized protein n=1 Tax=Pseudozyma flocculosa PF-1 TaxID=1277687 RepID=A0A061H5S8_9BASI|nr:uncharacterized protein PFL1_06894 [Pseudozyma flocculosa PF-1]EPQ27360.1 hypothetical protein PFL1_06894 [Pseudozyma flocculosa PF-1]
MLNQDLDQRHLASAPAPSTSASPTATRSSPESTDTSASNTAPATPPCFAARSASASTDAIALCGDESIAANSDRPTHRGITSQPRIRPQQGHLLSSYDPKQDPYTASMEAKLPTSPPTRPVSTSLSNCLDLRQEAAARLLTSSTVVHEQPSMEQPTRTAPAFSPTDRASADEASFADDVNDDDDDGDEHDDETDGFFSLDMDLDIDAPPSQITPGRVLGQSPLTGSSTPASQQAAPAAPATAASAHRASSFGASHSASPLPSFRRRDSRQDDTAPSPSFGPIVPEVDRRGNLEYKLKILPPTRERFDRLVTQLKWRLLEGGGLAVYEIGVLDDGTLIGLDGASMRDSLKLLSAMGREVGARCEVRRVLALERQAKQGSALGSPPSSPDPSEDADSAKGRDGGAISVRALDDAEARQVLTPVAGSAPSEDGHEHALHDAAGADTVGSYGFALSDGEYGDDDDDDDNDDDESAGNEAESATADGMLPGGPSDRGAAITPPGAIEVVESSDEEGFGFSLSIDGDTASDLGAQPGAPPTADEAGTAHSPPFPPDVVSANGSRSNRDVCLAGGGAADSSEGRLGPLDFAATPENAPATLEANGHAGDAPAARLEDSNGAQSAGQATAVPVAMPANGVERHVDQPSSNDEADPPALDPDFAAIDVKGLQSFALANGGARNGLRDGSNPGATLVNHSAPLGGRRGRDGRVPFADPALIVDPVSPTDYELLVGRQVKVNVGKLPKRRGKRRGASGWRIDSEDDRDGTGASLERRMRRLAELKAAERAGAGQLPAAGSGTNGALRQDASGISNSNSSSGNSIAQELVQQMLALQLAYPELRPRQDQGDAGIAEDGGSHGSSDGRAAVYRQPPFKAFDQDAVSPFLALDDAEIESARDADGIRELFQRKRQEILKARRAYKQSQRHQQQQVAAQATDESGASGITFLDPSTRADASRRRTGQQATAPRDEEGRRQQQQVETGAG